MFWQIFDFIFPQKCLGCSQEGDFLCEQCFLKIELKGLQHCPICKLKINQGEVCQKCRGKTPLRGVIAASSYEQNPLLRKLVRQFKYKYNDDLKEKLGEMLLRAVKIHLSSALKNIPLTQSYKPQASSPKPFLIYKSSPSSHLSTLNSNTFLVPVPLHFLRQWQRGFNQAELLAQEISQKTQLPVINLLKRIKHTPQQAKLARAERLKNLKNAFAIDDRKLQILKSKLPTPSPQLQAHQTIILVDDIASTLTTLQECARVLKKTGFRNIWGLVIARG